VLGQVPAQDGASTTGKVIRAYSPGRGTAGAYSAQIGDAHPLGLIGDESTIYCAYEKQVGQGPNETGLHATRYVPVYSDGALLDPAAGWDTAPYDMPLGQGLGLRVGDAAPGKGSAPEPVGNIHVLAGDRTVFSSDLTPPDYGTVNAVAANTGEILTAREWMVSEDMDGTQLGQVVWTFSPAGTPLRRVEVLHRVVGTIDGGGTRSRLSRDGALYTLTSDSDGLKIVKYVLVTNSDTEELPAEMPAGFGFAAKYGPGAFNAVDTVAGTCTKDLVDDGLATANLGLTRTELQELYGGLRDMDILGYGSHFQPESGGAQIQDLWPTYYLEIRIDGAVTKFVHWDDMYGSDRPDAVALRGWFARLRAMIEAKPEWQALPPAAGVRDG
jgi:hypothetical protein